MSASQVMFYLTHARKMTTKV
uniref:Uncharacterized protein n=1 Tax=Anguilla anguilla TaxID=7936 RepID=A0A0E9P8J3_ANGAN